MKTRTVTAESATVRTLRMRLNQAETRVLELEALIAPTLRLPKEQANLVTRLIASFMALDTAAHPLRGTPLDGQARYKRPDSSVDEGAATRWARDATKQLTSRVSGALNEADDRLAGTWQPTERRARVWCGNDACPNRGRKIPQFVGPGESIQLTRCPTCDKPLGTTPLPPRPRCWTRGCRGYARSYVDCCPDCNVADST